MPTDRRTRYYHGAQGHSCEDYSTGDVFRFWYDPTGVWMAERVRHPQADVSTFDVTDYL